MKTDNCKKCPLQKILKGIGGKWKLLIIFNLKQQSVVRFGELKRLLPEISQKVLTSQLKELEANGFVHRKVYAEVPPKVEYCLTSAGKSLYPVLDALVTWAEVNEVGEICDILSFELLSRT